MCITKWKVLRIFTVSLHDVGKTVLMVELAKWAICFAAQVRTTDRRKSLDSLLKSLNPKSPVKNILVAISDVFSVFLAFKRTNLLIRLGFAMNLTIIMISSGGCISKEATWCAVGTEFNSWPIEALWFVARISTVRLFHWGVLPCKSGGIYLLRHNYPWLAGVKCN